MPGEIESPHPVESLGAEDGQYLIYRHDANGVLLDRHAVTLEEALRFLNQLIALHGTDGVPWRRKGGTVGEGVATRDELRIALLGVLDAIWRGLPGDDPARASALADILRAVVTQPEAIRVLTEARGITPTFWRFVWPDLEQRLASVPDGVEPGDQVPIGLAEEGVSRTIEGAGRTGPGGVAGPAPAAPPLTPAGAAVPGGPATASGGAVVDAARAADPVLPFSGQLLVEVTDLELDGVGLDFALQRTYLHGVRYVGPLGPQWDHSYNLWLREALEPIPGTPGGGREHVVYRATGSLRMERFRAAVDQGATSPADVAEARFIPPDGTVDQLVKRAGRFVATTPDGREIEYNEHLLAETLRDRNGNELHLSYTGDPPRLTEIVDTCRRRIRFEYDAETRLCHVLDSSLDRHVWYGYDEGGRLQWVRKSLDPHRSILVAAYRYWGDGAPPGLEGNMLALADGRGQEVLQVRYGDEPGLISYNRVVEQRDGGVTRFDYEFLAEIDESDRVNAPILRVRMTLPGGDLQILDYSELGRLVRLQLEDRPLVAPRVLTSRWRYNADGNVVREDRPDGSRVAYTWGREVFAALRDPDEASPDERARFGQLRRIVEYRRPGTDGPFTRVTEYDYEPVHGLVAECRGPYYGDALGNRIDPGPAWSQRFGYDARGNLTSMRLPDCTLPDGPTQPGPELILRYDARGRLVRREVPLSSPEVLATELHYASDRDPFPDLEIVDADGLRLEHRFDYDGAGRALAAREPRGLEVRMTLDHLGRVLREETWEPGRGAPAVTRNDWGALDLPERIRLNRLDAMGIEDAGAELIEEFSFDAEGDVEASRLRSADGTIDRAVRYRRDPDRRLTAYTEAGVTVETRYDARGRPSETWLSAGTEETRRRRYRYDPAGRLESIRDGVSETRMAYDGFGRLARLEHPSGTEELLEWDAGDHLVRHRVVGAYPGVSRPTLLSEEARAYDEIGRLIRRTDAIFDPANPGAGGGRAVTTITHDRADRIVALRSPDGVLRTMRYDGLSRVIEVGDGVGTVVRSTYDDGTAEHTEEITLSGVDPAGAAVTRRFVTRTRTDAHGRVVAEIDGLGNTVTHAYDSRGLLTRTIDQAGVAAEYAYSADGRLARVTVGAQALTSYRYDPLGRLSAVDGPRGPISTVTRDAFGRPRTVATAAAAGRETVAYTYDEHGRVASATEVSGAATTYRYAADGGLEGATASPPRPQAASARHRAQGTFRYRFDGAGRLVEADDGLRPVRRRYDSRGLLIEETAGGATSSWTYDLGGRPIGFVFPDGRRLNFERLPDGRLQRVLDRPAGVPTPIELLRLWTLGAGTFPVQDWRGRLRREDTADPGGRLLYTRETRLADGRPILELSQLADARGLVRARRVEVDGTGETLAVELDGTGRIVRAAFDALTPVDVTPLLAPGAVLTQADLDQRWAGVIAAVPADAEEMRLTVDTDGARHEFVRRAARAVVERRRYDVDGIGRAVEIGSGRRDDLDGLPLAARGHSLGYDAWRRLARVDHGGRRVAEIAYDALGRIAAVTTPVGAWELLHAAGDLVEIRAGGTPSAQFVRLPGGPLVETGLPGAPLRPLLDGQGSVVGLTDGSSGPVASSFYDPFGERRRTQGASPAIGPSFHGLLAVPGLDLLLTPARSYEPRSGTFLEPDPLGFPDGPNRTLYAAGNPLAFNDPSGLMAQPADMAGRPGRLTYSFGYGEQTLENTWYNRALLVVAGAFTSLALGFVDLALSVVDVVGLTADALSGWQHDYQAKSGIGQAAQRGQIPLRGPFDGLRWIGEGIVGTPGRWYDAIERADYGAFGAETANLLGLAQGVRGLARGARGWRGSVAVKALTLLGPRGIRLRWRIRQAWLRQFQGSAARYAGIEAHHGAPERVRFFSRVRVASTNGRGPRPVFGVFRHRRDTINIAETVFRPWGGWTSIGAYPGTSRWARFRWEVGNVLRGNFALRVLAHENFHRYQFLTDRAAFHRFSRLPYSLNPREVRNPYLRPSWGPGAFDFEMTVPAGPLATGLGGLGFWLLGFSDSSDEES